MNSLTLDITYADDVFKNLSNGPYYSIDLFNFSCKDIHKLIKNKLNIDYINIISIPENSFIKVLFDSYKCDKELIIIDKILIKDFIKDVPYSTFFNYPYMFRYLEQTEELLYEFYDINNEVINYIDSSLKSAEFYENLIKKYSNAINYVPKNFITQNMIIYLITVHKIHFHFINTKITLDTFNKISEYLCYYDFYDILLNIEEVFDNVTDNHYTTVLAKYTKKYDYNNKNKKIQKLIFQYSDNKILINNMIKLNPSYIFENSDSLSKNIKNILLELKPSLLKYFNIDDDIAYKMIDMKFINIWYIKNLNENIYNYFISKYSAKRIENLYEKIKYRIDNNKPLKYIDYKKFIEFYNKSKPTIKKLCLNNVKIQTEDIILKYLDSDKNNVKYIKLYTKKIIDKINSQK